MSVTGVGIPRAAKARRSASSRLPTVLRTSKARALMARPINHRRRRWAAPLPRYSIPPGPDSPPGGARPLGVKFIAPPGVGRGHEAHRRVPLPRAAAEDRLLPSRPGVRHGGRIAPRVDQFLVSDVGAGLSNSRQEERP